MPGLTEFLGGPTSRPLVAGNVAGPLPVAHGDPLYVTISGPTGETRWGPCVWPHVEGQPMPALRVECLVAFDDTGRPWVVLLGA